MIWSHYLVDAEKGAFTSICKALTELLNLADDALAPGLSEVQFGDGFLSLAYDPANHFVAARWLRQARCHELFFVAPATKPAKLGYAELGVGAAEIPAQLQPWLSPHHQVTQLPSFTALASLLVSNGAAVRETSARERQLAADSGYLKQLLAEQSDLLRQTQVKLRAAQQACRLVPAGVEREPADDPGWDAALLSDWCATHDDEVVVLPRARNGAKKSHYEDPALMGVALELLAGPYREHRCGLLSREEFDAAILPTGLRLAGSVSPEVAGEQGEAYFVNWAGQRRFLDLHLLKGGGRDERYCFRLYFFWDAESQRAVVGSMPAHLSNSLS